MKNLLSLNLSFLKYRDVSPSSIKIFLVAEQFAMIQSLSFIPFTFLISRVGKTSIKLSFSHASTPVLLDESLSKYVRFN